jgi:hypothetical protein
VAANLSTFLQQPLKLVSREWGNLVAMIASELRKVLGFSLYEEDGKLYLSLNGGNTYHLECAILLIRDWILETGYWADNGQWLDDSLWNDG